MRWGVSATAGREVVEQQSHTARRLGARAAKRAQNPFRGAVSASTPVRNKGATNGPSLCRGFCASCDSFVCVVVHGARDSVSNTRFVVNPSSVVLR